MQEIAEAKWMPIGEYAASDFIQGNAAVRALVDTMQAHIERGYQGFQARQLQNRPGRPPQLVATGVHEGS